MMLCSPDGLKWYELTDEQFGEALADREVDFWVDLSDPTDGFFEHVPLSFIRKIGELHRED